MGYDLWQPCSDTVQNNGLKNTLGILAPAKCLLQLHLHAHKTFRKECAITAGSREPTQVRDSLHGVVVGRGEGGGGTLTPKG